MARRGRQNDEIKKLVEIAETSSDMTISTESIFARSVSNFDTVLLSTHNALSHAGTNSYIVFTSPRSAYYKMTMASGLNIVFAAGNVLGFPRVVTFEVYTDLGVNPTQFLDTMKPAPGGVKHTAAGTSDSTYTTCTSTSIRFLEAGTTVTIAVKVSGAFLGGDSVVLGGRAFFELLTDSRRLGSY